ncbi:uncharacterized protein [Euwallacea similis]|uniref:uncharacterized protein n=1 Tax=Euwallacea similis TaxID=1736056 RepID=UPI00344DA7BE
MPLSVFDLIYRLRQYPHALNKVSDFDGIVEKDYWDIPEQLCKEQNYLPKSTSNENDPRKGDIGTENVNLCAKHDPEKKRGMLDSRRAGSTGKRNQLKTHMIRVVPPLSRQEKCDTSNSKNYLKDLPLYLMKIDKGDQKDRKVPEHDDAESCKTVDGLCPFPLLGSMLITKLIQPKDGSKPYPLELDKPKTQQYSKNYMQRKKRQLKYLKIRETERKKLKTNRKNGRTYRSINETAQTQINNITEHISKNWTFNNTVTFTPLYSETINPAEGQVLVTGIKDHTSSEERFLLEKISSSKPENRITTALAPPVNAEVPEFFPNGTHPQSSPNGTLTSLGQSPQETWTNVQLPEATPSVRQDSQKLKSDFNLKINDPKFRKILLEIMHRQQNMASVEDLLQATTKMSKPTVANQSEPPVTTKNITNPALNSPASSAGQTTPDIANSSHSKSSFWGFMVPSPMHEADTKMNKSSKGSGKPEEITEALHVLDANFIKVGVSAKDDVQPVATQLSTTQNLLKSSALVSDKNDVTQKESSLEMKEKLSKLHKDLKMVQEIQNIFNDVASARKQHRKEKRSDGPKDEGNKRTQSEFEDKVKQYDNCRNDQKKEYRSNRQRRTFFRNELSKFTVTQSTHILRRNLANSNHKNDISAARDKGWKTKRDTSHYGKYQKHGEEFSVQLGYPY